MIHVLRKPPLHKAPNVVGISANVTKEYFYLVGSIISMLLV